MVVLAGQSDSSMAAVELYLTCCFLGAFGEKTMG